MLSQKGVCEMNVMKGLDDLDGQLIDGENNKMSEHRPWKKGDIVERRSGSFTIKFEILDGGKYIKTSSYGLWWYRICWLDSGCEVEIYPTVNDVVIVSPVDNARVQEEEISVLRTACEGLVEYFGPAEGHDGNARKFVRMAEGAIAKTKKVTK